LAGPTSSPSSPKPGSAAPLVEQPPKAAPLIAAATTLTEPPQPASSPAPSAAGSGPLSSDEPPAWDLETAGKFWLELSKKVPAKLKWRLSQVEPIAVVAPDVLMIAAKPGFNSESVEADCVPPDVLVQIEKALQKLIQRPVKIRYQRTTGADGASLDSRPADVRRTDALMADPMVQKVVELFEARTLQLEYDDTDPTP
jgi:hypothetical protein